MNIIFVYLDHCVLGFLLGIGNINEISILSILLEINGIFQNTLMFREYIILRKK